jgi:hypothetical protein
MLLRLFNSKLTVAWLRGKTPSVRAALQCQSVEDVRARGVLRTVLARDPVVRAGEDGYGSAVLHTDANDLKRPKSSRALLKRPLGFLDAVQHGLADRPSRTGCRLAVCGRHRQCGDTAE